MIIISKKITLNKDLLYQKYKVEKLSQQNVAKYFGVSVDTIVRNLKDYGIESNRPNDWMHENVIELNEEQLDILNGAMLGDGSLVCRKRGVNAQFCYTSKSRQHVEYVCKDFMDYSYTEGIKKVEIYDKRTNKIYQRYTYRSVCGTGFTKEYKRWYVNGVKHIPYDLKLNSTICLIWYIGDGGICHSKRSEYIKLSTNCFTKEEQEKILLPQLKKFEAKLIKADIGSDGKQQYFIYIPHSKEKEFLSFIGICPFDDYSYKWDIKEYVNAIPQNHADKEYDFCEKYKSGMTYYAIAKEYGIEPSAVKYYLVKNNLYKCNQRK